MKERSGSAAINFLKPRSVPLVATELDGVWHYWTSEERYTVPRRTHFQPEERIETMRRLSNAVTDDNAASARAEIERVLQTYEAALNNSDTDTVISLFSPDGVFMAPNRSSTVGVDAIKAAYEGIFQAIAFHTELQVDEIMQIAPNWAFVRTNSNGFVTVKAIEQRVPDANHELFVFYKDQDNAWKIARYCFSTTLPLRQ
ncbi:uncharacterized protein (TIGR02246 family) [Rhizobium sp. BK196]|uniref:YybH family protein n=1 Tax=Rhizobium sp. BK196 TaxID=2587073 RepID=UPI00161D1AE4|nr:SgcJ/EcaC family oxidoreductase [Rhizobium sp. BK196]MBB3308492.1 uncharacterized protein (TIGR02246 family) [Rhizobium sp. BK196]